MGQKAKYKKGLSSGRLGAALLMTSFLSACSSLGSLPFIGTDQTDASTAADDGLTEKIPYGVEITGIDDQDKAIIAQLNETSTALRLKEKPPATFAGIDRRAEDDETRFMAVLRSLGFYDAHVDYEIDQKTSPVTLKYKIVLNTPYLLGDVRFSITRPDKTITRDVTDKELEKLGLEIGQRADAEKIILAQEQVLDVFRDQGFPLVKATDRTVIANTGEKTLSVTYNIVTDKKADFGKTSVKGATAVEPDFIAGYRNWSKGALYNPEQIRTTRTDLAQTGLFDSVTVKPVGPVSETGEIPVEIQVREAKPRSIGGGVDYSTAEGPGINAFWEHRNLFGRGEKFRIDGEASSLSQGMDFSFNKPQFLSRDQTFVAESSVKNYSTDAYDGELINGFGGIKKDLGADWSTTFGPTVEYSNLSGSDVTEDQFYLLGLRGTLRHDSTKNPLDPIQGDRIEINVSPYTDATDINTNFVSTSVTATKYLSIDDDGDFVLAGRGKVGGIFGLSRSDLPSNKRFYSGGGGSVRGYEYQKIGPLAKDDDNNPIGGRSIIETGLEFRARITDTIGIVPFVEGGNVYESSTPENFDLYWATGLGFRYYTPVGPVRFDVAVPLDKRDNIDDDYQFYISLGQAF